MKAKIVLSASQPPVSIRSARCWVSSSTAVRSAASELAQAASTVPLYAPRSRRLAILPATTLPRKPGKEFSVQGGKAAVYRRAISSASRSLSPQLRTAALSAGVWSRAASGIMLELPPQTPSTTPVRAGSYHSEVSQPASRSTSLATWRLSSWISPVASSVLGGMPNSRGSKRNGGRKPPRRQ
jgi:hypothetical protein